MSEVLDKVGRYAESGQTRLYLQTLDLHDLDHLHLVADEIKPTSSPRCRRADAPCTPSEASPWASESARHAPSSWRGGRRPQRSGVAGSPIA